MYKIKYLHLYQINNYKKYFDNFRTQLKAWSWIATLVQKLCEMRKIRVLIINFNYFKLKFFNEKMFNISVLAEMIV